MIPAVDEALRRVLRAAALPDEAVAVTFDAPTKDWAARRTAPTVDLYLYDIHEVVTRREQGRLPVRVDGPVTGYRGPQRWYALSYLLTAWTSRPEDEHALLAACLTGLLRYDALPGEWLGAGVASLPVQLDVAQPPPTDRRSPDLWSALGGELKPSLDLKVTVPLDAGEVLVAARPVTEQPVLVAQGHGVGRGAVEERVQGRAGS